MKFSILLRSSKKHKIDKDLKLIVPYKKNKIRAFATEVQTIEIKSDRIKASFNLSNEFEFNPSKLIFEHVNIYEAQINYKSLYLENTSNNIIYLQSIESTKKYFKIQKPLKYPVYILPHTSLEIKLKFIPPKIGEISASLRLFSTDQPFAEIDMLAFVSRDLKFNQAILTRILNAFNAAKDEFDIIRLVKDDPHHKVEKGRGINRPTARRIIQMRDSLVNRKFTKLGQIDNVHGIGEDTIHDIIYSFN